VSTIRKTKTRSGSTAVQVVHYKNRKLIIEKHIGSGKSKGEIELLVKKGKQYIREHSRQEELFPENSASIVTTTKVTTTELRLLGVSHSFTYELFIRVAKYCGLDSNKDRFLLDFAIMRLIEPASKLRTIKLLERYFDIIYSERTVYRKILRLDIRKQSIEQIAIKCAKEMLQEDLALVLYDVTTLYFESFKGDELRIEGFSKDNKPQQPQIVVGLIVTRQGFPLGYEVFPGNTFEGKTMLKVLDDFTMKNHTKRPIIVADAAMLSKENIEELEKRNLSYIVGARLGNTSLKIIQTAHGKLQSKDGKSIRIKTITGELIIDFSKKRYSKDKKEMDKQLLKAKQLVEKNQPGKRVKFVKHKDKESRYILNEALIKKTKLLLGMKGYSSNISETVLSNKDIITRYHDLWHVEQAFRMAKSDLASRPIFHHKQEAVKSHILICFVALIIGKFLEINTKLSLKQIIDAIWEVTDAKLYDKNSNNTFTLRSELNQYSKEVIDEINSALSY
jgi:transposase